MTKRQCGRLLTPLEWVGNRNDNPFGLFEGTGV